MAVLFTPPYAEFMNDNGDPLAGGKVYAYAAGTLTPKDTYTDSTEATPNANPVILDSAGRANIWINGSYKFIVKDSLDVTIRTIDNVSSFNTSSSTIDALVPTQTGNSGKALVTNGATVSWGYPGPSLASLSGKILSGLTLSNNGSDATNDIDIAAGYCVSDDGTTLMTISSTITKQLDASWAVGNNQGGRDTGSIADNYWYVWVIHRSDTSVTDVLFSLSATAPTMPSSYDKKKRIGTIVRASSAILAFRQSGTVFKYTTSRLTTGTIGTSRTLVTLLCPPSVEALVRANMSAASGNFGILQEASETDAAPTSGSVPGCSLSWGAGLAASGDFRLVVNSSSQIAARSGTASTTYNVYVYGWNDIGI